MKFQSYDKFIVRRKHRILIFYIIKEKLKGRLFLINNG